jgi:hypothetical protein
VLQQQKHKLYKTDNSGIDNRDSANSAGHSSKHSYAAFSHDKTATSSTYACLLKCVGITGETKTRRKRPRLLGQIGGGEGVDYARLGGGDSYATMRSATKLYYM